MEAVDDLPAAPTTVRADHRFCIVHLFQRALVQNTSAFPEEFMTSYMTSCINSTRCWKCNRTLYVLSLLLSNTLSKHIKCEPRRCTLTPLPKHKRRAERLTAQTDRRRSRPM